MRNRTVGRLAGSVRSPSARFLLHAVPWAGAAVVLLVTVPSGWAAVPAAAVTAPYTGGATNAYSAFVAGCAYASIVVPPAFSLSSGSGGATYHVGAKTCKGILGASQGSYASVAGTTTVGVKFKLGATGATSVVANWTFTVAGHQNMTSAACLMGKKATYGSCIAEAEAYVSVSSSLVDLKTGAIYYASGYLVEYNLSYNISSCHNQSCTVYSSGVTPGGFSAAFPVQFTFSGSLNARHTFELYTSIYESASLDFVTSHAEFASPMHGTASIDMASGGNGAVLNSITAT